MMPTSAHRQAGVCGYRGCCI